MTAIAIVHGLPFVSVIVHANRQALELNRVLLDTGSAATIFKTDDMMALGIVLRPDDSIRYMAGVGGSEIVVEKQVATVQVGDLLVSPFTIQMGAVDYGIRMDGILGLDFMLQAGAYIDFHNLEIRSGRLLS